MLNQFTVRCFSDHISVRPSVCPGRVRGRKRSPVSLTTIRLPRRTQPTPTQPTPTQPRPTLAAVLSLSVLGVILFGGWGSPGIAAGPSSDRTRPLNVLMIMVDDLRPELGCYGADHIHSPHLDRLASEGRLFENAYCQQAVCNASRTSLMTGRRPDSTGVTGNHVHFRDRHPDLVTLPQHFKRRGYHAAAIGKIYHGVFPEGASATKWDTMGDPQSWSVPALRFGPRYYFTEEGISVARRVYQEVYRPRNPGPDDWTTKLVFGPATESPSVGDDAMYDGKVANAAVERLREFSQQQQPFFLAVGFIKPHSPYIAPRKYFELYDEVEIAEPTELPTGAPGFAGHSSGELRRYTDQPKRGPIPAANQRRVRQAYFACVSFIDAQIGRVLNELDRSGMRETTIVIVVGDHGYHLGEQGLWGKTTNFELDTRVPLIVRVPSNPSPGVPSDSIVELVSLYPTLAELAGLPRPGEAEGQSFASVVADPSSRKGQVAISQYPRGGRMGYSIRTPRHRFTRWIDRSTREVHAEELYEYASGRVEMTNLVGDRPKLAEDLAARLVTHLDPPEASDEVQEDSTEGNRESPVEDFEKVPAGDFKNLKTSMGHWNAAEGISRIDDRHGHSGRQCLQMTGGERCELILDLDEDVDTSGELRFRAERWTRRSPFSFRIEKDNGHGWREVYDGDQKIKVGRAFLSDVRVTLADPSIKRLRLQVTSPAGTGVLIDDLKFVEARRQEIVSAESVPLTLPALRGTNWSPLLKLKVETRGTLKPIKLNECVGKFFAGSSRSTELQLFSTGANATFSPAQPFGRQFDSDASARDAGQGTPEDSGVDWHFDGQQTLSDGSNYFWVACRVGEEADIDGRVGASCRRMKFSNGREFSLDETVVSQRLGVAVRQAGQDGVHTCRIPGLATSNRGTLIAVYDARHRGRGDLPGDIDVGMSRSTDGGRTWEPMRVIMDMGDDPDWRYDGIGDPAVLVDRNTGTIWVAATWSHGNRSWVGSGPGLAPQETGQLMLVRSDDDGATWSDPINITAQVKRPEWCFLLQGPGKGITMKDGTLVFAAQYQDPPENKRLPHSTILFSKDHGETWQVGTGAFEDTTEAQVVEVEPGVLMLNCRYNRKPVRVVMTTRDMGKTWEKHPTSERSLIEPGACMASLIDVGAETRGADDWMLFSNPDSTAGRKRIMIKLSPDRGMSWPANSRLLLDEGSGAGYSCMSMVDDHTVGILYEGSQAQMSFQRIPVGELLPPAEPSANTHRSDELLPRLSASEKTALGIEPTLRMPRVFGSDMVMQADQRLPVWGRARPATSVSVRLGQELRETVSDQFGNWRVEFPPQPAGWDTTEMLVRCGEERIRLRGIVFGEVWLCAGQSNMEWPLSRSVGGHQEAASASNSRIRMLHLKGGATGSSGSYGETQLRRLQPGTFCEGEWQIADTESASAFSAVGWYFGRQLAETLEVPVGLICAAVGGTPAESWIPRSALASDEELSDLVEGYWLDNDQLGEFCRDRAGQNFAAAMRDGLEIPGDLNGPDHSFKPGFMWEAAMQPLAPFSIRGFVWYQGESNAGSVERVLQHQRLFPLLVRQWRNAWKNPRLPFLFVQLPALQREAWPSFRDSQRRMLFELEHVSMAVTMDTGDRSNVHPAEKRAVGERLAGLALAQPPGPRGEAGRGPATAGPLVSAFKVDGNVVELLFAHVGEGLRSSDEQPIRHFEIAGADGVFFSGQATIAGEDTVRVSSPRVDRPSVVRYAWMGFPDPPLNLTDSQGLPASPFSTADSIQDAVVQEARTAAAHRDQRPNVLLIVGEDHGCELSCYGDPVVKTARIDELASQGVLFENAYVTQSVCSPSRSTIFTGLYPHQNGQLGLATHRYGWFRRWPTSYSLLKSSGYRTGLIGKTHVIPEEAVEDHVDFRFQPASNFAKKGLSQYAIEAGKFFNEGDQPFFMTVNYPDAHWPLQESVEGLPGKGVDPSALRVLPFMGDGNPRLLKIVKNYYDCMLRLDACVGQLLDQLERSGKSENTLVIFIGDHGAQMARGKVTVYEGGIRVPMIVRWPKVATPGLRSRQLVSTIDLLPTFLQLAGVKSPAGLPGRSLLQLLTENGSAGEGHEPWRRYLACERNCDAARHTFPQRTIRDARFKLIHSLVRDREDPAARYYREHGASHWSGCMTEEELQSASVRTREGYARWLNPPEYQLYDLQSDPHEWTDLADEPRHAETLDRLKAALRQWQMETADPLADPVQLKMLVGENEQVFRAGKRWPEGGWKYLQYLAPERSGGSAGGSR